MAKRSSTKQSQNDKLLLSEAVEGYWLDKRLGFSATSIPRYRLTLCRLMEFLGDPPFASVTSDDIRRFLIHLSEKGLSKRTVHDCWIHLSSLWTWAQKELGAEHIIRGRIKRPGFTKRKIEPFTQAEIKRILGSVTTNRRRLRGKTVEFNRTNGERDLAIVLTLLDSGLRASELCALTLADYDDKRGRLHVQHGKMDKERFVVIGKRTQKALWRYLAQREDAKASDPLFTTRYGTPITRTELRHQLKRIGERAKVAGVHPHRFRHTFAISFMRNGGNMAVLKELLGHATLEMVLVYAQVAEMDIDDASKFSPVDGWRL